MGNPEPSPLSETVREHASRTYVGPARQRGQKVVTINVGEVHKAVALRNRVPLVCQALKSEKFLEANGLRLVSQTGPPSGQSTTVTYTYEFADVSSSPPEEAPWNRLRGVLKDIFAEYGGGEAYLREERRNFYEPPESK